MPVLSTAHAETARCLASSVLALGLRSGACPPTGTVNYVVSAFRSCLARPLLLLLGTGMGVSLISCSGLRAPTGRRTHCTSLSPYCAAASTFSNRPRPESMTDSHRRMCSGAEFDEFDEFYDRHILRETCIYNKPAPLPSILGQLEGSGASSRRK